MSKFSTRFLVLTVICAVCLITSNMFVPRLWQLGNTSIQLSGAVLVFPISYIINDCLTEVYGYRKARLALWLTFSMSVFVAIMSALVSSLPEPLDKESAEMAVHFNALYMLVPRTTIASLLAFILGSNLNAVIMSKMKVRSKGKHFGVRAILSSIGGEVLDSLVFFPIAYLGILSPKVLFSLFCTEVFVKTLYEILVLPLTTRIVRIIKKKEGIDTFDENISYNLFNLKDIA